MEIKGKVHCFFEQSGTFKNEFIKLGIPAEDYDIQNNFGQTDNVIDLFSEIDKEYAILQRERGRERTIFTNITKDDLIVAFYPCIYFTGSVNPCYFTLENINYRSLTAEEKFKAMIDRADKRNDFYKRLYRLCGICTILNIRLIIENPYSTLHYLHNNFLKEPAIIDHNRQRRGDYFVKPTGYWFFNCKPTFGESFQKPKKTLQVWDCKGGIKAGICSEERSMISSDYARNWICDFILGKYQEDISGPTLFDMGDYIQ